MLAGSHRQGTVSPFEDGLAGQHREVAGLLETVEAIAAGSAGAKTAFVGVDLEFRSRGGSAKPGSGATLVEANDEARVVQPHDFELAAGVEPQRRRAERDLGAGAVVGGDAVAAGQRPVAGNADPFVGIAAVEPDLTADLAQAGDAAWRVDIGRLRPRESRAEEQQQ